MAAPSVGIRRFRPDDVLPMFEAAVESIDEVYPWLPWCHPAYTLEEAAQWVTSREKAWTDGAEYSFVIFDPDTDRFLGGIGINQLNTLHRWANLGYWMRSSATGRGLAVEATRMAARFGLVQLQLQRVEILVATGNTRSERVAVKSGATREGVLRNRLLLGGRPRDAWMFSLVPADLGV